MTERPQPLRDSEKNKHAADAAGAAVSFGDSVRPEILLPGASLSLGFALLLLQPHPLLHPVVSYGILLCITTALFLYGRKISEMLAVVAASVVGRDVILPVTDTAP